MGETVSVDTLMKKKFKIYGFQQELIDIIGEAEVGFSCLIYGASGNGKSTFAMILAKLLSLYGKVYFDSVEQGKSKSLQDLCKHVGMLDAGANFTIGDRDDYDEMMDKLLRNRARFVVIDSAQYMNLTVEQYKKMTETYKNKAFIIISWEEAGKPKGKACQAIEFMCDIKIHVKQGKAVIKSRFGATEPFLIPGVYEKFHKKETPKSSQLPLDL